MARSKSAAQSAEPETASKDNGHLVRLAAQIVSSYIQGNRAIGNDVPAMIGAVHQALAQLSSGAPPVEGAHKPAVPVRKSVADDFIICLEDGKKLTMLKRYLKTHHNLTPEEYRKKWDLPHDYPMVAPAYARLRSSFAKKIGLGRIAVTGRGRRKAKAV